MSQQKEGGHQVLHMPWKVQESAGASKMGIKLFKKQDDIVVPSLSESSRKTCLLPELTILLPWGQKKRGCVNEGTHLWLVGNG
jgi:hypothetical protein